MTDKINDGGPAFPPVHDPRTHESGMTLRDWFAGQAAGGLLAHPKCAMVGPGYEHTTHCVAREAYFIADAMLAARKGGAA